jgi:hypothetical protein
MIVTSISVAQNTHNSQSHSQVKKPAILVHAGCCFRYLSLKGAALGVGLWRSSWKHVMVHDANASEARRRPSRRVGGGPEQFLAAAIDNRKVAGGIFFQSVNTMLLAKFERAGSGRWLERTAREEVVITIPFGPPLTYCFHHVSYHNHRDQHEVVR